MTSAPSLFPTELSLIVSSTGRTSAGPIGKVTGLAPDRYQTHTKSGGAECLSSSHPSGGRRTHGAPDLAARDALFAPYSGDRIGGFVRVHGPRLGDEPRGRPGGLRPGRRGPGPPKPRR